MAKIELDRSSITRKISIENGINTKLRIPK
jgi:hypothetical protein